MIGGWEGNSRPPDKGYFLTALHQEVRPVTEAQLIQLRPGPPVVLWALSHSSP